jgi:cytidylate kinase
MNNTLMVYLNKRLHHDEHRFAENDRQPGPVICISREVGCGAVSLAGMLAAELDKKSLCRKWRVLSKEILEESARELDMDPNKLSNYLKDGDRGIFDDILSAFSEKRFKSDRKINKTLVDLIQSFANDGYCIIVGRASHILAKDIEKSLLVKLTAPLEWRVKQIMQKNNLNLRQAYDFIEKTEKEREIFRRHISSDNSIPEEFDLTINLSRITVENAISLISQACQLKGLIEANKSKVEVF